MELASEWVELPGTPGALSAYLVRPARVGAPLPGVVVVQEIWGVDGHIQDVAERLATAGYVALAPDLYSVGGARPPVLARERVEAAKAFLNTIPPGDWMTVLGEGARRREALARLPGEEGERVGETLGALFGGAEGDPGRHQHALETAVGFIGSHPACGGRPVGAVGFCMGGSLAAQLACEASGLAAAAVFYGSSPSPEQARRIRCPLRGFYGEDDPHIVSGLPAFAQALDAAGVDHELRIYPGAGHAFFNDTRPSYRPDAARDAWARTLALFAEALGPAPAVAPAVAAAGLGGAGGGS